MSEIILKVENVSKQYRLGQVGTGTITHDLNRWWAKMRGKEDPFLKIGETNDRSIKGDSDYVWALQNINFEVNQGEVLGIIGKNGAGKSTLLKILSRVTSPTTGSIKTKGRIASLLEVGTGFHPEMTGRENIYLNGAILGMTKKEIASKMDEIIEFSGCERYIDTPVKRYSSGMTVRLAFAVAAHLDPEILVVDEVLAVGDAEFQKKAIGKMQDMSRDGGRTVLFVSHNMVAVQSLCTRLIVVENGNISYDGNVEQGIREYLNSNKINSSLYKVNQFITENDDTEFKLLDYKIHQGEVDNYNFLSNENINISFNYIVKNNIQGLRVGFDLIDLSSEVVVFRSFNDDNSHAISITDAGKYCSKVIIPPNLLKSGLYGLKFSIGIHAVRWLVHDDDLVVNFFVSNNDGTNKAYKDQRPGIIMPMLNWENTLIKTQIDV